MRILRLALFAIIACSGSVRAADQIVGPWNLTALKSHVPPMKWVRQDQPIQSLNYAAEKHQGHDTEVFAFYASRSRSA